MTESPRIRLVDWHEAAVPATALRMQVFVHEQGVPANIELDGLDEECVHALAETAHGLIGTGRLLSQGRIGRLAVVPEWRGRGVGRALLDALVGCARDRGFATVELHAQCHAIAFYEAAGFRAEGPEFDDGGIPHRHMWRALRH